MVAAIVAWAGAFVVAADPSGRDGGVGLLPAPVLTAPAFEPGVLIGLAVPLFVVTMASQNVTGMTVLASGIVPLGISAPFWGLVAGLAVLAVQHRRAAA